jgi:hypothetical protein
MQSADLTVSASPNQVSGVMHGETILLSSTTNQYYGLHEVGSRIWELIQQPRRVSSICSELCMDFDVDPVVCETDVRKLIQKLLDAGLVQVEE